VLAVEAQAAGPQTGTVARLGPERRFGYVSDATGTHHFIFVVGTAISNRDAAKLRVGAAVRFEVVGQGRVERLVVV
jgi:cold shock CspA family protein